MHGLESMEVKMIILLHDLLFDVAMSLTFCTVIVQNDIFKNFEEISYLLICEANSSRQISLWHNIFQDN